MFQMILNNFQKIFEKFFFGHNWKKFFFEIFNFLDVSDDSEQLSKKIFESFFRGGGHQGAEIFFFQILAELGHSESILIFSNFLQNRSDRGGRGGFTDAGSFTLFMAYLR